MSLSTTKKAFAATLYELADRAYFRCTFLVASAHNMPVESYPWRFAAVVSVGSHDGEDPFDYFYNPVAACRVLRARRGRRRSVAGWRQDALQRQQLRDASHLGNRRAHAAASIRS